MMLLMLMMMMMMMLLMLMLLMMMLLMMMLLMMMLLMMMLLMMLLMMMLLMMLLMKKRKTTMLLTKMIGLTRHIDEAAQVALRKAFVSSNGLRSQSRTPNFQTSENLLNAKTKKHQVYFIASPIPLSSLFFLLPPPRPTRN